MRFFDVQHGKVTLDGRDIREIELNALRASIAVVEQTPYLFRASIRENITYGRPGATFDEIKACAESAGIHRFIQCLPEGYETLIGERGSTLSVGERQRIALARALLRNPSILILDEPTSALDTESEAIVTDELKRGLGGRTTLVITHRTSLVRAADMVLVLEKGRIVEQEALEKVTDRMSFRALQLRDAEPSIVGS